MKTLTADELRAHALRTGAEVVIDGRPFNTARVQIQPITKPSKSLATPVPMPTPPQSPPQSTFTRADVEQMLAEQEQRLQAHFLTVVAMMKPAAKPARARPIGVVPTYDQKNAIISVAIKYQQ